MSNHPIVGFGFLALVVGGIGYGASQGVAASLATMAAHAAEEHARQEAEERARQEAEKVAHDAKIQEVMRAAVMAVQSENFDDAIKLLSQLAEQEPKDAAVWLNLGIAQRAAERWDDADASFQKVLAINPEDFDAVAERATVKKVKGDIEGALTLFESIPISEGRMLERLAYDPTFADLDKNERFQKLLEKHDAKALRTSLLAEQAKEQAAEKKK
jgi:tetratricopeptide (TPR) repeat protein